MAISSIGSWLSDAMISTLARSGRRVSGPKPALVLSASTASMSAPGRLPLQISFRSVILTK